VLGSQGAPPAAPGELPQAARIPAAVRLLRDRRRPALGRIEPAKGWRPTLRALQSIRGRFADDQPIYVILDNLNHHKNASVRQWCADNDVEVVFTPTYASWASPIEAHFGPLRQSVLANSDQPDHTALAKAIRAYLRWRNAHTRDPKILEVERRHRARIRSEQQRRWGRTPTRRRARERLWSGRLSVSQRKAVIDFGKPASRSQTMRASGK
jgi:DDE superfamily endonuclease